MAFSVAAPVSFDFSLRGAAVSANCLAPSARSYFPNGWQLLKDAGVNWIRVSGGTEGDINHFNIRNYPNEWAQNLDNFLAQADSYGIKVSFASVGSAYGTLFGIRSPGYVGSEANGADPYGYTPIDQAEAIIDQLAGNNSLHHNFIADPRVLGWVTSNEVYIGPQTNSNPNLNGPFILQWNLQLLDYIHSKGGKAWMASPTTIRGSSAGYDFAQTIPLIGGHVDYLEAHYYEEVTLLNNYVKPDGTYDWANFETYYRNRLLTKMVNARGNFSLDNVLLGEFGMWVGQGNDFGLSTSFTAQDRTNYYQVVLDSAKAVGLKNVCPFDFFEMYGTSINDYSIVSLKTKNYFPGEAADVLREAYGIYSVSLSVDSSAVTAGSSVGISGILFPINSGVDVSISLKPSGGAWSSVASVTTDSAGKFSYVWSGMSVGSYDVKASWIGNGTTLIESSVATVNVNPAVSSISVNANPLTATVNDDVGINGAITPVRSDASVTLSYSTLGSVWNKLVSVETDSAGQFSYSWSGMNAGSYQVKASWQGDALTAGAESSAAAVTVNPVASSISLRVNSSSVTAGSRVLVSGQVVPVQSGVVVTVSSRRSEGEVAWSTLDSVQTDSLGYFSYVWAGTTVGSYEIKASWQGNARTAGATSNVIVVNVTPSNSSGVSPIASVSLKGASGDNGWFASDVTVTLSTTGNSSGNSDKIGYSFDNTSWTSYIAPFNITRTGTNILYYKATDKAGIAETPKTVTIKIDKTPPQANAGGNITANVSEQISFDGSGSTDDVGVVGYSWVFGDGSSAETQKSTHAYSVAGTYTVTLTVIDAAGNTASDTATVKVDLIVTGTASNSPWIMLAMASALIVGVALTVTAIVMKRKKWSFRLKIFS